MVGLNEKDMQAVVNTYALNDYYYPTLFPLKETTTLTWKMLEGQAGLRIAADLVARGASIPRKTREAIQRIQGDIPKIAVGRDKLEDELTEYDIMLAMSSNSPDLRAIVEFWAEDVKYCWDGVAARLEWIALQQISLGKVSITNANNASVISQFDVDYQLDATTQKGGVNTSWASGTSGKPFSKDFPAVVKAFRQKGIYLKYAFMNLDTFVQLASQDETIKMCATMLANVAGAAMTPGIVDVNAAMSRRPDLYGLQIVVIDQWITIELADGSRATVNPFETNVVSLSATNVLGKTYWKRPIDMNLQTDAYMALNGHTLIKKYSEEEPVKECTQGIANAFPGWSEAPRTYLMQTNNTSWNIN